MFKVKGQDHSVK